MTQVMSGTSQLPVTSILGDLIPSSGLLGFQGGKRMILNSRILTGSWDHKVSVIIDILERSSPHGDAVTFVSLDGGSICLVHFVN